MKKQDKTEGIFAIISALLVIFTAMLNPIYSVIISVALLIIFSLYKFLKR
jgi:hypothetical protein